MSRASRRTARDDETVAERYDRTDILLILIIIFLFLRRRMRSIILLSNAFGRGRILPRVLPHVLSSSSSSASIRGLTTITAMQKPPRNEKVVVLDGQIGEGGGQILRTALSLSMTSGKSFHLDNIRPNRPVPGIQQQHLTCIQAATQICDATVRGAEIGSTSLVFEPGTVRPGEYEFSVHTAGSAVLVFQTVLPALMIANRPSTMVFRGGTHNPYAPTFDFLQYCFLPLLRKLGPQCDVLLQRPGFFPVGGGRFRVELTPTPRSKLRFLLLNHRGGFKRKEVHSVFAGHSFRYGKEQARRLIEAMQWSEVSYYLDEWESDCPGMVLTVLLQSDHITECFTSIANPRQKEPIAPMNDLIGQLRYYIASDAPVGELLADQLILPMALGRGGEFMCTKVTEHTRTQIDVVKKFLAVDIVVEKTKDGKAWNILIGT